MKWWLCLTMTAPNDSSFSFECGRLAGSYEQRQICTLRTYRHCFIDDGADNQNVKTIVNIAHVGRMDSPHHAVYAPGISAVAATHATLEGSKDGKPILAPLVLHRYAVKSMADWNANLESDRVLFGVDDAFWSAVENRCVWVP